MTKRERKRRRGEGPFHKGASSPEKDETTDVVVEDENTVGDVENVDKDYYGTSDGESKKRPSHAAESRTREKSRR